MGEPAADPTVARPLLKPWYRLSLEGGSAVLRYGGSVLEFEGRAARQLLPHLLPLLDGTLTVDDVVARLGEPVRPAIERALDLLRERQLLTAPLPGTLGAEERQTLELLAATDVSGRPAAELLPRLAAAHALVVGTGPTAAELVRLLRASAVGTVTAHAWDEPPPAGAFAIVAPGACEVPLVREWNRLALEHDAPWLQVLPFDGLVAAVGPLFVPGETACHECYRLRRTANVSPLADPGSPPAQGSFPTAPAVDGMLAALAALSALRTLVLDDGELAGVVLAVELTPGLACSRHMVYRVPRCPACSRAAAEAPPLPWHGAADVAA
jgi:bacteriocin biosynthesis cyclodehydratase domain-containing protein